MNRKTSILLGLLLLVSGLWAKEEEKVKVNRFYYAGPVEVRKPILSDSLNVEGKKYDPKSLLKSSVSFDRLLANPIVLEADTAGKVFFEGVPEKNALHVLSFYLNSDRYTKGRLEVKGPGDFEVYVDRKPVGKTAELTLEPRRYEVLVKYLSTEKDTCEHAVSAQFTTSQTAEIKASPDPAKRYTLEEMISGKDFRSASLSPNGKYVLIRYVNRMNDGKSEQYTLLKDTKTDRIIMQGTGTLNNVRWTKSSNKLTYSRTGANGTELVYLDPQTLQEEVVAEGLPKGNFRFTPDEKTLIYTVEEEGPKEGPDLTRILEPGDRIPGFRKRTFIWRYDLENGLFEQLTYGHKSTSIQDISPDGRHLLFNTSERVYTSRPFSRSSFYKLDLQTLAIDTIWESVPYIQRAVFSPDAKKLLVTGGADAFDGIGLNIPEGEISNSYDNQLFLYDLISRKVTPLTKTFDPSVNGAVWNKADGQIYIVAEDRDYQRLFTCNPATGNIKQLPVEEDVVMSFTMAENTPLIYYFGQSISNANRLYAYDIKTNKTRLIDDLSAERLKHIQLGKAEDWNFVSDDGTTITGRYYLPPNFDPEKKYPMIVYYYGGTSPTNRTLEGRYSMHMYAAQGYVVYTLNPSGTTGFGQEFSSRHVNAWGKRTAEEIIKGTERFCEEHPFVDKSKIGCIGASYGGFMTQYLQTRTDLFAAAVSHAGISALSSYWGEGYWGYGYSSVANADSYPWNNPQLFTEQSPLFNADKIHTPLLLLHGGVDTNVPIGESIQMFTALKLLGREVEFIRVEGEDHGIVAHKKRIGWQNSINAWFAKWLKEQPEWWNELYPERTL